MCTDQTIRIRRWQHGDAERLRRAGAGLSAGSLRLRFGSGTPSVPREYLRTLERLPASSAGGDASVVVALDGDRVIGWAEARAVGSGEAEVAVVVLDDWQGRGVAKRLIRAVADEPAAHGRTLHASVLPENTAAHRLARAVAPDGLERAYRDGYVHYKLAA